jgi:hypothetical protein
MTAPLDIPNSAQTPLLGKQNSFLDKKMYCLLKHCRLNRKKTKMTNERPQLLIIQMVHVSRSGWLFGGCSWRGFLAFRALLAASSLAPAHPGGNLPHSACWSHDNLL